jgi:hypothetical protein
MQYGMCLNSLFNGFIMSCLIQQKPYIWTMCTLNLFFVTQNLAHAPCLLCLWNKYF